MAKSKIVKKKNGQLYPGPQRVSTAVMFLLFDLLLLELFIVIECPYSFDYR